MRRASINELYGGKIFMKCPICNKEMIRGDILFKTPWPGAFYPEGSKDTVSRYNLKLISSSESAIGFFGADEGWYCEDCKKVVAILSTDRDA